MLSILAQLQVDPSGFADAPNVYQRRTPGMNDLTDGLLRVCGALHVFQANWRFLALSLFSFSFLAFFFLRFFF